MGDKVEPRREYISQYADFNREDSFTTLTEQSGRRRQALVSRKDDDRPRSSKKTFFPMPMEEVMHMSP